MKDFLGAELKKIKEDGLYKEERIITTPQRADIKVNEGQEVLNFCANNYLGLSDHPRLIKAAKEAMDSRGYGMSSVRFICGTQDMHKDLEAAIARFFRTDDTITSIPKTLFFMLLASMPTEVCLSLSLVQKMPLLAMPSITLLLLTGYVSARQSVIVMPMVTWQSSKSVSKKHKHNVIVSL